MKRYLNPDGVKRCPDAIRSLPFCCWRWEKDGSGRDTKIPYNPKTGAKAKVDKPSTFGSMKEAMAAFEKGGYAGIAVNIAESGGSVAKIGCIDLDHCIEGNTVSPSTQTVMDTLPNAYAEYSPSHTGLHLFFTVPEGFSYDTDTYYINNRRNGMEIYLPGTTRHFMTVTGDIYRAGDLDVAAEQLQSFQDTFMRRPHMRAVTTPLPEGGSVLSDAEVMRKLASDPNGERFMKMYRGEWEECRPENLSDNENWTQSEADCSVCTKLAFYCRGDAEQIDRLYRHSGLMREKWDKRIGNRTYGDITIAKAINTCSAFYDPPDRSSAAEDFDEAEEEDDCGTRIDALLESEITAEILLSEETLKLAAWAYKNDMFRYSQFRQSVPKAVGVRNFERAMKQKLPLISSPEPMHRSHPAELLKLPGISTPGMIVPENWLVDDHGIRHIEGEGIIIPVSTEPLFISAKMENVDDGTEKLEVTFRRNGRYKTLIAPRSDMLNKNSIIKFADEGLPVSSGTAGNLTKFIAEMEAANDKAIPLKRCIRRAGWFGELFSSTCEFFPYYLHSPMTAQEDGENAERFLEHLHSNGNERSWLETAAKVRALPFARAMLAASFASPLVFPLQHRNIYYHVWYDSKSGKTAALKFAMSVWGDPAALVKSYFATMVGMEHRAGTMKHLPLALDELQTLDKRVDVNNMVYTLGNGVGKTRGRAGGGIRAIDDWRNCILSTGEQPISTDSSMDGINTRLLEVYAATVPEPALASRMHQVSELNYGFAGGKYIRFLMEDVFRDKEKLNSDYQSMCGSLDMLYGTSDVAADNIAVLALADFYSSQALFDLDSDTAWREAVEMGAAIMEAQKQEDHTDSVNRAWDFVTGWVAGNKSRFATSTFSPPEIYGIVQDGKVFPIAAKLNEALTDAGFNYKKCIRGFCQRSYITRHTDSQGKNRSQILKSVKGVFTRVYELNLEMEKTWDDGENPLLD